MALNGLSTIAGVAAVLVGVTSQLAAQAPDGADRLSPGAVSESLKVLRSLERTVIKNKKDAESWHRRGMVAWALYERSRHQPPAKGLDWTLLIPLADTSLRRAVDIAPDNAAYFNSLARFLLGSAAQYRLYGPFGVFNDALEKARDAGDPAAHATAALNAGRVYWLRYENLTCRTYNPNIEGRMQIRRFRNAIELAWSKPTAKPLAFMDYKSTDYMGETDYLKAELLFREAYDASPKDLWAFRQYGALLADRRRWIPLAALARSRVDRMPRDGWGWMVLGLATQKSGDLLASARAFDSAFRYLDTAEVKRLDRIERVLSDRDAKNYASIVSTLGDTDRTRANEWYWREMDPLWSVPNTEPRLEFLARLTFAELRWTSEDRTLNGVNSDWGAWYIRTGQTPPLWDSLDPNTRSETDLCKPRRRAWYVMNDTTVVKGPQAQWFSLMRVQVDSIPIQTVRFRGGHDTTDVFIAALPPTERIQRSSSVRNPVRLDFWLRAGGIRDVARDSMTTGSGIVSMTRRVAPGGYTFRLEASADGALAAGRAAAGFYAGDDSLSGYTLSGFGMSDVLVASAAGQPASTRSWRDVRVVPLVGPALRKSQINLVWENYELAEHTAAANYDISIMIRRDDAKGRAGRIAASIVGAFASVAGVQRTNDAVEFTLSRSVPHAPLIVDNVSVSLGDTPVGRYLLTVRVTDRVSGRTTGRSQRLVIADPTPPRR